MVDGGGARRSPTGMSHEARRRGGFDHQSETIARCLPRPARDRFAEAEAFPHGTQRGRGQQVAAQQSIKQQRRRGGRSDHEPVIDPSRMIAPGVAPSGPDQIVRRAGKTRIGDAERHQHQARERLADLLAFGMLDQLADEQITHIRIRPTRAGLDPSRVRVHPCEQVATGQGGSTRLPPRHGSQRVRHSPARPHDAAATGAAYSAGRQAAYRA